MSYGKSAYGELAHMANRLWQISIWQTGVWQNLVFPYKSEKLYFLTIQDAEFSLRGGFSVQESDLCDSAKKYIYPKKAKSTQGIWHYIINTDEYRQGVLIETCLKFIKGGSCLYGGTEGINPSGTVCQQRYSSHFMLALSPNGTINLEEFSVPSSCACFIKDQDFII